MVPHLELARGADQDGVANLPRVPATGIFQSCVVGIKFIYSWVRFRIRLDFAGVVIVFFYRHLSTFGTKFLPAVRDKVSSDRIMTSAIKEECN